MDFIEAVDVGKLTTFGISAKSRLFVELNHIDDLQRLSDFLDDYDKEFLLLGAGSNTVFVNDFQGLVAKVNFQGWEVISESDSEVIVRVLAGSDWHEFVMWCVENNYGGLENLALIPGNVGTAPVQNIGAYGVEVKDFIRLVEFFDFSEKKMRKILNEDCGFGYRDSVFKHDLKSKGIICAVEFRLSKKGFHKLNLSYAPVSEALSFLDEPSIHDVADAVIGIRSSKLPDWRKVGTAGSFFKNPVVEFSVGQNLKNSFPDMPIYEFGQDYKLAAGWLIENVGLKGFKYKNLGVYEKQALVLVALNSNATGDELIELIEIIKQKVKEKFKIDLETEVNVV